MLSGPVLRGQSSPFCLTYDRHRCSGISIYCPDQACAVGATDFAEERQKSSPIQVATQDTRRRSGRKQNNVRRQERLRPRPLRRHRIYGKISRGAPFKDRTEPAVGRVRAQRGQGEEGA